MTKAVNGGSYFDNPDFGIDNISENDADNSDNNKIDVMKWPTEDTLTTITSKFGPRNAPTEGASTEHRGIDIGIPEGTNVYACESGTVITASYSKTAGNWIIIDHGNGYTSKYMHNSELKVSVGDEVKKGQLIALSGNTGVSTGAHLHFQIECEGGAIDPLLFKFSNGIGSGDGGVGSDINNSSKYTTKYYAKVATWTENTIRIDSNDPDTSSSNVTNYNMMATNINYQDAIKEYTMPFEYLWALLVVSEDKEFVLELADLVYNSEIEITVHDNLEIDTNTIVNTYTKKKKTITDAQVTIYYGDEVGPNLENFKDNWEDEESENYKVTQTIVTKTNTLDISLTKADVWMQTYTQDYAQQQPNVVTTNNNVKLEDKDYPNSPNSISKEDTYGHAQNLLDTKGEIYKKNEKYNYFGGQIDDIQSKIYNATVDRNKETTNVVETTNYVASPGNTIEKTDKKAKEDNFVKIFIKSKYIATRKKILGVLDWLFKILEENESTEHMVDLTKYLIYKAIDIDYGVIKYDFSIYNNSDFLDLSNSTSSIAKGGKGTIGVYTSTNDSKYNLYLQGSGAPWANEDYGTSHSMALAGCGPTAAAIIASSYNADITPSTFRKVVVDLYGLGNHSSPAYIQKAFNKLLPGVKTVVGDSFDKNKIKNCLQNSGQVWLIVQNCKYTSDAHCIALIDYKENLQGEGTVYVAHGTARSKPYGWDTLNSIQNCYKPSGVLYIGGK